MSLDVAMGGSTNTVLHILAIANEAGVDFTLDDIDAISRRVPCLCKVAPNSTTYHIEHVHRAGGIPALLGELDRAGLLNRDVHSVHADSLSDWLGAWDVRGGTATDEATHRFLAAPGGVRTTQAFSTANLFESLDTDSEAGCIRSVEHAYTKDGGLAVLYGNIAANGAIIKSAGIDESILRFVGKARVVRVAGGRRAPAILGGSRSSAGDVVVISLRGPQGRPRHAGNALPDLVSEKRPARQGLRAGDRRTVLGRHVRTVDRTRIARSGGRRRHRAGTGRRPDRHRHTEPHDRRRAARRRTGPPPRGDRPLRTRRGATESSAGP